jgi:hypothetical protein
MFTSVDKAIVALLGGLLTLFAAFGIDVAWAKPEVIQAVGALLTTFFVWAVPNKKV